MANRNLLLSLAGPLLASYLQEPDLIELMGTRVAASPNACLTAIVSTRSLAGVPVPCALM